MYRLCCVIGSAGDDGGDTRNDAAGREWGGRDAHDINEPGGRLFGEPIRAPGERRVWFDWEYAYYAGLGSAAVLLVVGLGSQPGKSFDDTVEADAAQRLADGKYD